MISGHRNKMTPKWHSVIDYQRSLIIYWWCTQPSSEKLLVVVGIKQKDPQVDHLKRLRRLGSLNPKWYVYITPIPVNGQLSMWKNRQKDSSQWGKGILMRGYFPETTEKTHIQTWKEHGEKQRTYTSSSQKKIPACMRWSTYKVSAFS